MIERHMAWVETHGQRSRRMWHKITKPLPWRSRTKVFEDVFEVAQPLPRVEVKRRDWKTHWHVDTPDQVLDDKSRWSSSSKVLLELRKESCKKIAAFLTNCAVVHLDSLMEWLRAPVVQEWKTWSRVR